MTQPLLHPWLQTEGAVRAARRAVAIPMSKLPVRSQMIGADELFSEALSILTECALPPRERQATLCAFCGGLIPETVRKNAKYCSPQCSSNYRSQRCRGTAPSERSEQAPSHPKTHIGSMWTWDPGQMEQWATREVGFRLCNYVSLGRLETPSSQTLYNLAIAEEVQPEARDLIEQWLEAQGVHCRGDETIEELTEVCRHIRPALELATA